MHRVHLASDLHLGAPDAAHSRERELRFIGWLEDSAAGHNHAQEGPATEIHLVGDIFDFWHEYKHAQGRHMSKHRVIHRQLRKCEMSTAHMLDHASRAHRPEIFVLPGQNRGGDPAST